MQTATQHIDLADMPETTETSNFAYSFSFLPRAEREAMNTVYAFCRYTDDIVDAEPQQRDDESIAKKRALLSKWRSEVDKCYEGNSQHPLLRNLTPVVHRFDIPRQYFHTLIDGCERDLVQHQYQTFEELQEYCYSVASIVGLMCIEIFGYRHDETREYAVNLGYAMQLTNIIRDVHEDYKNGRIYLPMEDLERFKYTERDLANGIYNDNFVNLMSFQVRRSREYYHKARAALRSDERFTLFAAEVMDAIYYRLLEKIELNDYNVFSGKIRVSTPHKFLIALRLWMKSRFLQRRKPAIQSDVQ